jgi:uncharacterized protein (TIGR01244 family)
MTRPKPWNDLMDARRIAAEFVVSGQIQTSDLPEIAKAGFKSVICNRPDHEQPGQPASAEIEAAAKAAGLAFRDIPVSGAFGPTPDNLQATIEALNTLPRPIFAYCRSGARSTNLYGLAVANGAQA